jgi:hypothetical protein
MSDATLTIVATLTGGAGARSSELQCLVRACELALHQVRGAGGTQTSGTAVAEVGSASFDYAPVATS